jgi:hypothetical protein
MYTGSTRLRGFLRTALLLFLMLSALAIAGRSASLPVRAIRFVSREVGGGKACRLVCASARGERQTSSTRDVRKRDSRNKARSAAAHPF